MCASAGQRQPWPQQRWLPQRDAFAGRPEGSRCSSGPLGGLVLSVDQNGVGPDLAVGAKDDFTKPPALAFDSDSLRDINERHLASRTPSKEGIHRSIQGRAIIASPVLMRLPINLAEREGFEPPIPVKVCPLSRRIVSTTHAPLRKRSLAWSLALGHECANCLTFASRFRKTLQHFGATTCQNASLTSMRWFRLG